MQAISLDINISVAVAVQIILFGSAVIGHLAFKLQGIHVQLGLNLLSKPFPPV